MSTGDIVGYGVFLKRPFEGELAKGYVDLEGGHIQNEQDVIDLFLSEAADFTEEDISSVVPILDYRTPRPTSTTGTSYSQKE